MLFNEIDPVEALASKVRYCIDHDQGEDLVNCLEAADTYLSDRKELMYNAYFAAGEYKTKENDPFNSMLLFNKARKFNPRTIVVFDKLIDSLLLFYAPNKDHFIKSDLINLIPAIKTLIDYYNTVARSNDSVKRAEDLLISIAYRHEFIAPDAVEGSMTYRVNVIKDALEKDVPMEQVKIEVARFIADLLKKKIVEDKNTKEKKASC